MALLSTKKSVSTSVTQAYDLRTAVEGGAGILVGPKATMGGPLTTSIGDYSAMTQTITGSKFKFGLSGAEVKDLVQQANVAAATNLQANAATVEKLASLANTALGAVQQAQTGVPADWQKYIVPVGVILLIALAMRSKRRAA